MKPAYLFILFWLVCSCKTGQQKPQPSPEKLPATQFPYYPLRSEKDLDVLINEVGDAKIVLLGEASHGTSEYYTWRAAISKRLIEEKGFDFIAVEGDWVDLYKANQFIKGRSGNNVIDIVKTFDRWPQWLWANHEFAEFAEWLKTHNQNLPAENKTGFYGLDVFAFAKALDELIPLVADSSTLNVIATTKECLKAYGTDALAYSNAVSKSAPDCMQNVAALWQSIQKITGGKIRSENDLLLLQNAAVLLNGERYFRTRTKDHASSWNGRVMHMQQTIRRLQEFRGKNSKVIVWAHNTHVGDAHYTDMPTRNRTNIGQLLRKEHGEKNVFITGFGSYTGEVVAGMYWGAPFQTIKLRPAKEGTWEHMLHVDAPVNKIILSKDIRNNKALTKWVAQRAIGVVHTETYIPSILPRRYDAFIYFDTSTPLRPVMK